MPEAEIDAFSARFRAHSLDSLQKSKNSQAQFCDYKIGELRRVADQAKMKCPRILNFGSGIGGSLSGFRRSFKESELTCASFSKEYIACAQQEFPRAEDHLLVRESGIPMPDASFELAFSNCVFNQIPKEDHQNWFKELQRVVKPGGKLVVFEPNPRNPFSARTAGMHSSGANVRLIGPQEMKRTVLAAGWDGVKIDYHILLPAMLAKLRPLGRGLRWCGLGRQYMTVAERWV
ncbi:class I SAM-dependent methyltransferase [Pseudohalocynthiibacter sp. F2068]|uniref:class I SAM-dependent methyltransferase n=1 Tax=Pseudohalocynthiibacter sp. F2068 TaxID=2926418 RepID=UPI001FF1AA0B|nr:class I SAM-dependent methyltransferase [Pseudohalocynthiibacter sp. F2068]MCK0102529.1 class I SAM-dependent methyltransferase [Pseudohalocynthiibacter sp. F2068]